MTTVVLTGSAINDVFDTTALNIPGVTLYEINTGLGDDRIITNNVAQTVFAGQGNDYVVTGSAADFINGGPGDDQLFGMGGDDTINGGSGSDYIDGGKGNDVINGGSGDDFIFGRKGNNELFGGAGNDTINTGDHTSTADGGIGDDLLVARLKNGGDHTLTGGEGADTFEFIYQSAKKSSDLTITDFELGVDELIVQGMTGLEWAAELLAGTTDISVTANEAGDAVLDIGFNDSITFDGVQLGDFLSYYLSTALVVA